MNTITNFRMNQPTINQQNNSISNKQRLYKPAYNQSQNVQFKGFGLKSIFTNSKTLERASVECKKEIAQILRVSDDEIMARTKGISTNKLQFLSSITHKFHAKYGLDIGKEGTENTDIVFKIFDSVKNPKKEHFSLINGIHGKMSKIKETFEIIGEDKNKLSLADNINQLIHRANYREASPNLMTDMLKSENAELYAKNFSEYKPYLLAHKEDENAVKNLDKMVNAGTYDKNIVERENWFDDIFRHNTLKETGEFNLKSLKQNYTEERGQFLDAFTKYFGCSTDSLKAGNDKDVMAMYKSTTKDNIDLRCRILKTFESNRFDNYHSNHFNQNVADLHELFDRIDSDKHAANYIKKALAKNNMPRRISSLNTLFSRISTKKLDIFYDNAQNIMGQVHGEEKFEVLNREITNPLFLTPEKKAHIQEMKDIGLHEGFTFGQKIKRVLKNQISKIRYGMSEDKQAKITQEAQNQAEIADIKRRMEEFLPTASEPANSSIAEPITTQIATTPLETKAAEIVKITPVETVAEPVSQPVKKKAIRHFNVLKAPKAPNAKKLAVINDVNQIIEKKLGSKTLAEQKRDYAITATKMRMQMLPEIFESIKETRAMERAAGVKKPSVSNKDALSLYSRINGRNKKLVNYMLKKRNADGTRTFKFNEILSTIEQSESKLHKQKFASPKTYKAADGKAYYANLLEAQIQEHGKLQRTRKSSK